MPLQPKEACLQVEIDFKNECMAGDVIESLSSRVDEHTNGTGVIRSACLVAWKQQGLVMQTDLIQDPIIACQLILKPGSSLHTVCAHAKLCQPCQRPSLDPA